MFQFSGLTSDIIGYSIARVGCPIRILTDQRLFAPPRYFSQLITSFIVSESQGIPRTPLLTFFYNFTYRSILLKFYFLFTFIPNMSKNFNCLLLQVNYLEDCEPQTCHNPSKCEVNYVDIHGIEPCSCFMRHRISSCIPVF